MNKSLTYNKTGRCSFERWRDVRVYPKGPQSIIQIENDHALRSRSVKIESHETFWNGAGTYGEGADHRKR